MDAAVQSIRTTRFFFFGARFPAPSTLPDHVGHTPPPPLPHPHGIPVGLARTSFSSSSVALAELRSYPCSSRVSWAPVRCTGDEHVGRTQAPPRFADVFRWPASAHSLGRRAAELPDHLHPSLFFTLVLVFAASWRLFSASTPPSCLPRAGGCRVIYRNILISHSFPTNNQACLKFGRPIQHQRPTFRRALNTSPGGRYTYRRTHAHW